MKELTQVRDAVMTALDDAGLRTMATFPAGRAKQYTDPVVTVAVGSAEGKDLDSAITWARPTTRQRARCWSCTANSWRALSP